MHVTKHVTKTTRISNRILAASTLAGALALTACQNLPDTQPDDQGTISLAVSAAPAGVACLRITTAGAARSVVRTVPITAGLSVSTNLSGLPTGQVSVLAEAFAESCAAITGSSVATWNSDPFALTLSAGVVQPVQLTMRQNGRISVSVDWDTSDGTASDGGSGTGIGGAPGTDGGRGGTGGSVGMTGSGGFATTGSGGSTTTGSGGFATTGSGGSITGAAGATMTGSGGSTGGGCPGCARLLVPLTGGGQAGLATLDFTMAPFNGTNATLTARLCALNATGGGIELVAFSGPNFDLGGTLTAFSSIASCGTGFTNVTFPLVPQAMFNPAAIELVGIAIVSTDPGPWANPTVVQIDSITLSNNVVGPFTFDASTLPLSIGSGSPMGTALSWVGP